ncbi:hypothetical protein [Paracoccus beibuensis]|uniref:hypothetical protein n=1 Tax=Paracoccus beibuensis TaxID=547602 RepID=UPI00223F3DF3|nr:hypothetical protein [Paracoccus beibuensis]
MKYLSFAFFVSVYASVAIGAGALLAGHLGDVGISLASAVLGGAWLAGVRVEWVRLFGQKGGAA